MMLETQYRRLLLALVFYLLPSFAGPCYVYLYSLSFPVASCSSKTINDLSLRLMIKITNSFLKVEGKKEDKCGYDTPGITWKKDS